MSRFIRERHLVLPAPLATNLLAATSSASTCFSRLESFSKRRRYQKSCDLGTRGVPANKWWDLQSKREAQAGGREVERGQNVGRAATHLGVGEGARDDRLKLGRQAGGDALLQSTEHQQLE